MLLRVALENTGNIGKAYRRHDEVGTPLCLTVDFETIEQQPESVTIRDRDTMAQIRLNTTNLAEYLRELFFVIAKICKAGAFYGAGTSFAYMTNFPKFCCSSK